MNVAGYLVPIALASIGCTSSLDGRWRAELASPGGPLPFGLQIDGDVAVLINGEERVPVSAVTADDDRVVITIDWYDAEIRATRSADRLTGRWKKRVRGGWSELPFSAVRGAHPRFESTTASGAASLKTVAGAWRVMFEDSDGSYLARGEFRQDGTRATGTFLTATGDYRFLDGTYEDGVLRLSCFDGAHAFLFVARATIDGGLVGDFWSRDVYHATWTAVRATGDDLPDPYGLATLENDEGRLRFSFPDEAGRPVSLDDPRFADKVVIVDIFGTWCPNCNDQAPVLRDWYERYRGDGLEIVGLAYEVTGDVERDQKQIAVYRTRHDLEFPILLAGISDKKLASETLPDLSEVVAFPTTIFIGRDGRVRRIHAGFSGPGTGDRFTALIADQEAELLRLLAEPTASKSD